MFLSSVMEQVSAVETKALLSGPACAAKLLQAPIPCLTTSTRSPVPLNLSFVKPPSTSQCPNTTTRPSVPPPPSTSQYPITTTRPPVLLTSTVKDPPPATLQPGAVCGNPSASIQPSSPSFQSDRHESQGFISNTVRKINVNTVVKLHFLCFVVLIYFSPYPLHFTEITHQMTLFLLDLTKTHQQLYFRNKMAFYKKIQNSFSQKGYNLSSEKILKKLANMLTTYKRVKDLRRATGEGKITWEYYTLMDELFGSSGIGTAPLGTIHSTPLGLEETSTQSMPTTSSLQDQPACASMDEQPGTSTIPNTNVTSRQRRPQPLQFLEAYEEHAERRTAVLESLVRPDLERWWRLKERRRRSFEKNMVTSLGTIVEELQKMGKRQEQIMHLLQNPHEPQ
ncbi:uncharacterized protein LOC127643165 [Xyrauchen texanus]|uniref:uncharacterized protein LOC127643165 n=1 Tax=Xyrauchen texanus TaxID=154827 RepID=UPI002242229A|nr:uncharacterized protein LOC127643165 [Xyrauchen texanus]